MKPLQKSKKLNIFSVVFLLLIGISLGGFLVLKSGYGTASIGQQLSKILEKDKEIIEECQPNPSSKTKDSDNDGLLDWQEATWRTNACKPDTDEDGYLDGEEVASGYDPTQAAPNDKLSNKQSIEPRPLPNNLTRALAQNLTQQMMTGQMGIMTDALDPSSINVSNQAVNQAIQETISKTMLDFSLPNIPDNQIIIISDNSRAAFQDYLGQVINIMDHQEQEIFGSQPKLFESEAELFYYTIQNRDFTEINKYIELYQRTSENIKQIPVPSELKNIHRELIGIFWVMDNIYQSIQQIDQDPLKTILALEQYQAVSDQMNQMLLKLAELNQNKE